MQKSNRIKIRIALLALAGALSNQLIRGGGIETILKVKNIPGLKYVNAILFGVLSWYLSGSIILSILLCIGMFVGSMPALGQYMSAMLGQNPDHDAMWGLYRMSLRGLIWGAAIGLGALISSIWVDVPYLWPFILSTAAAGATQGLCAMAMIWFYKKIEWGNPVFNFWTGYEQLHGMPLYACLIFISRFI